MRMLTLQSALLVMYGPLKDLSQTGNVDGLLAFIQNDPDAFHRFDKEELVDTPLHIAAHAGQADFAMTIMNLKPAWGRKLNQDFKSPMHIAIQCGHKEFVLRLLAANKDLVRVKGGDGFTALHFAAQAGDIFLLVHFLKDCPTCVEDVTSHKETALHVAARRRQMEALEILARFLQRTHIYCQVSKRHLLDSKDSDGNTVLHIAARFGDTLMIGLLLECEVNIEETDFYGRTALDILERSTTDQNPIREIMRRRVKYGAMNLINHRFFLSQRGKSLQEKLEVPITYFEKLLLATTGTIGYMSPEKINALLVVLALILTTTYQAMISPPGGVWQGEYSANTTNSAETRVGQSVMDTQAFVDFYALNFGVFVFTSILTIGFLQVASSSSFIAILFELLLALLLDCLLAAQQVMLPTTASKAKVLIFISVSPQSFYKNDRYLAVTFGVFVLMEVGRKAFMRLLNPPVLRFYKTLFRDM